jgi:hypothetical protein
MEGCILKNGLFVPKNVPDVWSESKNTKWIRLHVYVPPKTNPKATYLLPKAKHRAQWLVDNGIAYVDNWAIADIIATSHEKDMKTFLSRHRTKPRQKIFIHCHEPGWCSLKSNTVFSNRPIHVMSVYEGGVFLNSLYSFIPPSKPFDMIDPPKKLVRKIVMLATNHMGKYKWGTAGDLASIRSQIGILGHRFGFVSVYGKKWPRGVSRGSSRKNRKQSKPKILEPYQFCLCFENSYAKNYVTEKIWEAINCNCLPIYFGSPWIYEVFPPDSFLDYAQIGLPARLFAIIKHMKPEEYARRLNKCYKVVNDLMLRKEDFLKPCYDRLIETIKELNKT